jgi:hypothetical protein
LQLCYDVLRRGPVVANTDDVRLKAVEGVRHELVVHLGAVDALPYLRHTGSASERASVYLIREGRGGDITMRGRPHRGG